MTQENKTNSLKLNQTSSTTEEKRKVMPTHYATYNTTRRCCKSRPKVVLPKIWANLTHIVDVDDILIVHMYVMVAFFGVMIHSDS